MTDQRTRELCESVLRRNGWLSRRPGALVDDVLRRGNPQRFAPGSDIYRPGDRADGVYGVVDGLVALMVAPVGLPPAILHHASVGSWLGALEFFGAGRRMAGLRAVSETLVFHLPSLAMEAIVTREPRYSRAFGEMVAENAALCLQVVDDLLQPDTGRRVAATLLRATRDGAMRIPLTQLDLATMANASRRQVNTILQGFASRGWIAQGYGSVTVLDAQGLRRSLEAAVEGVADRADQTAGLAAGYSPPPRVLT